MSGSAKIQPSHLQRQGVVYLRQSTAKQVLENRESTLNQKALRGRLLELGWKKDQVVLIDEDQGLSGKQAAGREGFQKLVADVGLRKVGIIMGYEVSRLSRNCADWHQLLELCALFDTLIADSDGIYHPRDFNDRLLLGLKGTMSAAELHSLRLRLDAGRRSKAQRGELVQHLPTGLLRVENGTVILDPDVSIQERVRLVFRKFLELGTVHKVLFFLARNHLQVPRCQRSGLYAGRVLWKDPAEPALLSMLKNPAYAGAFAHGRRRVDPTRQIPGRPSTGLIRRPRDQWTALVKDVYPAYITWDQFEAIQQQIAANQQKMQDQFARKRAVRQGAALLTSLVRCAKCGHSMSVSYKGRRFQYKCDVARTTLAKPSCQFISGLAIDSAVTQEFFRALQPAQIDALEQVTAKQADHHRELLTHLEQEVTRAEYAAHRAERQYQAVDPENRLVAGTLEKNWEQALADWRQAQSRLADARQASPAPALIPAELRGAFVNVGQRLPELWPRLSPESQKSLLRTLITSVNVRRDTDGLAQLRIAWRGGLVSEHLVRVPVQTLRFSLLETKTAETMRQLADQGHSDEQIADDLNARGLQPCRGERFTAIVVGKVRRRHGIVHNLEKVRQGQVASGYSIRELASKLRIDANWFYRCIHDGRITITKDARFGCYLFPRSPDTLDHLRRLHRGELQHASFPKGHSSG
jgi:DNA invertase Pin-like site-specific DNA recombinase